jgi:hypothetical protein
MERHTRGEELRRIYFDVLDTGRELAVDMPVLESLRSFFVARTTEAAYDLDDSKEDDDGENASVRARPTTEKRTGSKAAPGSVKWGVGARLVVEVSQAAMNFDRRERPTDHER